MKTAIFVSAVLIAMAINKPIISDRAVFVAILSTMFLVSDLISWLIKVADETNRPS